MIRIHWREQVFDVERLVLHRDDPGRARAAEFRLEVADDRAEPRRGDFWFGCHPRAGWGEADPAAVGWASGVEVPVALAALRRGTRADGPLFVGVN